MIAVKFYGPIGPWTADSTCREGQVVRGGGGGGHRGWPQYGLRFQLVVRACAIGTCSSDCWFYWLPERRAGGGTVPVPLTEASVCVCGGGGGK